MIFNLNLKLTFTILCLLLIKVLSQTICFNPTTNCFDPITTQSVLFQYGQFTTCSRVSPITQLNCIDGNTISSIGLCAKYSKLITNIKCSNSGSDASGNVIWKCDTNLPRGIMFGSTTVSCEGCINSSDKLKITGSCGIFYQLIKKENTPIISNPSNNSDKYLNGFVIFICFISGAIILICLIKLCVGETDYNYENISRSNNRSRSRSRSRNSYISVSAPEEVIIPETIPLTTGYSVQTNNPPTNPNYQSGSTYQTTNQHLLNNQFPIRQPIYRREPVQVEMTTQYMSRTQPHIHQNDTSSFLSGYLVGKNLEEGNIGTAYMASTLGLNGNSNCNGSGNGNNYSTGMALGMMEGSTHSHKSHHKKKHHHYNENNDLESNQISFESNETYANSTTR